MRWAEWIDQPLAECRVIVVVCLVSWTLSRLHWSPVWLLLVLAVCRTRHRVCLGRTERSLRDELERQEARQRSQTHGESVEWVNGLLDKLWTQYEQPLCARAVRYINGELAATASTQQIVLGAVETFPQPLRWNRVRVSSASPGSANLILEGEFEIEIAPPLVHRHRRHRHRHRSRSRSRSRQLLRRGQAPLVALSIRYNQTAVAAGQHDLAVQIYRFSSRGRVRVELVLDAEQPQILPPQIELADRPVLDCTLRTLHHEDHDLHDDDDDDDDERGGKHRKHLHFPFHFAHHIDWRRVVESQIRAGLGRAFHEPLALTAFWLRLTRWFWHFHEEKQVN
ncbi:hypothetical protein ASPZODRAFT_133764 [Penicilliopsis zonata CBS 506.65]|uniref:SMP-LTD domain-containing protein n=1 Tax=Penicilliopsis zonata CBS 506.65 TaxID=1073090 RepID=A0A1L9SFB8_9EURO|nr:hypothetical protein ASPZODRAFT_133764 [Penicilliopsis zonata CBS 506.65]OJJ45896.1 hypothetical protein ASPZODRAFT_133764 [Penicilliopsis zonata CBS 506.65]